MLVRRIDDIDIASGNHEILKPPAGGFSLGRWQALSNLNLAMSVYLKHPCEAQGSTASAIPTHKMHRFPIELKKDHIALMPLHCWWIGRNSSGIWDAGKRFFGSSFKETTDTDV